MGAPKQPIHPTFDDFAKKNRKKLERITALAVRDILQNDTPVGEAVDKAVMETAYVAFVTGAIVKSQMEVVAKVMPSVPDDLMRRNYFLNELWPGDDLKLSARINDISRMTEIKATLRNSMRQAKSWQSVARDIRVNDLTVADLPKHIARLERSARAVMAGQKGAFDEYRRALRASGKNIERLARNGAPTTRLKKAYQGVIKATEKMSVKALERSMSSAILNKAQYNAERIARTEMARGYIQGQYLEAVTDDEVVGIAYRLSARHLVYDICDFHTGVDMYNMGPGGYPLNNLPPYPFHPQCTCVAEKIFKGETNPKPRDNKKAVGWIRKQSADEKKALMSTRGAKNFNRNPNGWNKNLRHWNGHENVNKLLKTTKGVSEL